MAQLTTSRHSGQQVIPDFADQTNHWLQTRHMLSLKIILRVPVFRHVLKLYPIQLIRRTQLIRATRHNTRIERIAYFRTGSDIESLEVPANHNRYLDKLPLLFVALINQIVQRHFLALSVISRSIELICLKSCFRSMEIQLQSRTNPQAVIAELISKANHSA